MRIHSDILIDVDLRQAAALMDGVSVTFARFGSHSRDRAYEVTLSGTSSHRARGGRADVPAATWDEWGVFLAELFRRDSETKTPYYEDAEDFHWQTNGRFANLTSDLMEKRHRWEFEGDSITGSYSVHSCSTCGALRRFKNYR